MEKQLLTTFLQKSKFWTENKEKNNFSGSGKNYLLFLFVIFLFLSKPEASSAQATYAQSTIPLSFSSIPAATNYTGFPSLDDSEIGPLNLPFNFQFFGQNVTQYYVSTNGFIFFNNSSALNITSSADLHIGFANTPAYYIKNQVLGTAPNRVMVIEYFTTYCCSDVGRSNFQFKLFETTNVIEIHVNQMSYAHTTGISNAGGPFSNPVYGPGYSQINSNAYRFTPIASSPTISAAHVTGLPSTQVVVPVTVSDFNNMVTAQGSLTYNTSVATFVGVEQYGLPNLGSSNFGTNTPGTVTYSWDDQTLQGVTLPNNTTIFALRFNVVGALGTSTPITFGNYPTLTEFANTSLTPLSVTTSSGSITVPSNYITTGSVSTNVCAGSSINVPFTSGGTFGGGNIFTVQLSDASGSFASPQNIGTGTASPIAGTIPAGTSLGTNYRIRIISSMPSVTGSENGSNITISAIQSAPTTTAGVTCGPGSVTLTAAGAPASGSYQWYNTPSGGTPISGVSTATYTTPVINTTATYYVSIVNSGGCESARTSVQAIVDAVPLAPSTTNASRCGSGSFMLSASGGSGPGSYRWYTDPSGGTALGVNGDTYATPVLTTTTTYYVAVVSTNGCESSRTPITATVNPAVASPTTTGATSCGPGSVILTATGTPSGGSYVWYTTPSGGAFIVGETGPTYTTPALTTTTTYYVAAYHNGCESPRVAVTATVNPALMPPTATGGSNCGPGAVTLIAMGAPGGGPYIWYTTASGGTPINGATSATYITPVLTTTTTYYVSFYSNDCETARTPVTATINPVPAAPVASYNNPLSAGSTLQLSATTVSGATYSWTGPNGFTSTLQNPTIANVSGLHAGTYSVTAVINGCSSAIAMVNVEMILAVSGIVRSEHNTPINTVSLTTTGGTVQNSTTNATGAYSFNFTSGGNYTVVAAKNNDVVANNGVTTLDIALVRRHLLGVQALSSPYKILAADVNSSDAVTTADIAQMRSLILTTTTSFNGQQWKFVAGNYVFSNPANPFPYNSTVSTLTLNNLSAPQTIDFIGLKLGDVNNTWDNSIAKLQVAGDLHLLLPAKQVQLQDTVLVPVRVKDFTHVSGYQFTMEWNNQVLQYIGVVPTALQGAYGQQQSSNGKLTTTWDEPAGQSLSLADSTVIFQLKFKAIGPVGSVSPVSITSNLTKAESYNNQLAPLNLLANTGQVQIGTVAGIAAGLNQGYAFLQNYPNPFSSNTTFSFVLPKAEEVSLIIYNSLGQIVGTHQDIYEAGEHKLEVQKLQIKNLSSGAYSVSFTAGGFSAVKKMVVLK